MIYLTINAYSKEDEEIVSWLVLGKYSQDKIEELLGEKVDGYGEYDLTEGKYFYTLELTEMENTT